MPRCFRRTNVAVTFIVLAIFIFFHLWTVDDTPDVSITQDAKYVKLLRDYQAKRIKKSDKVVIKYDENQVKAKLLTRPQKPPSIPIIPQEYVAPSVRPNSVILAPESTVTTIADLFIAVKSSEKFHKTRLPLLLSTWIPLARQSVCTSLTWP